MSDAPTSSKKGLIAIGKAKGLPLIDNYNSHPVLCQDFMSGLLKDWCSKAESVIKNSKEALPDSDIEAMHFYLERTEEKADQVTLYYRIIFECKQAIKFLEKSEIILKAAYGLEDETIARLKRSGVFKYDEQSISYQAAYHVFQAQYCMHIAELLGSEDVIMHGQKMLQHSREGRKKSAKIRSVKKRNARWQEWAEAVWRENSAKNIGEIARAIKKRHHIEEAENTIRQIIKKPADL